MSFVGVFFINLNAFNGVASDDGEKIGEPPDPRERIDDLFFRDRALKLDHEAVFLEAAGDGARKNLGQVEAAARQNVKHGLRSNQDSNGG